jgi:hypothetical protein
VNINSTPGTAGSIRVQAVNSCGSSTNRTLGVSFVQCIIRSQELVENISLFPNPSTNEVTIALGESSDQMIYVKCVNAIGQVVYQTEMMSQDAILKINTASLSEGLYII